MLIASSLALATVWYARFYQAEPAPVVRTTKCPESLCLMLVLPSSERRVPSPPRTLLLVLRSYRLIRQSLLALLSFGYSPRSRSLCRLLPAPAASGTFPTLFCESLLRCLSPCPGGPLSAFAWFFLRVIGFPPQRKGRLSRFCPRTRFSTARVSRLQLFRYVQASQLARLPDRSYRGKYFCRAAKAFTSELNVCRYLHTHRIRYPPDYRQLAVRGLAPRWIRSFVGCSPLLSRPIGGAGHRRSVIAFGPIVRRNTWFSSRR